MTAPVIEPIDPVGPDFDDVFALYRRDSKTLGFLPEGAMRQFAEEGCVLAARVNGAIVGYVAYRVSGREAVLVHLCVERGSRRQNLAAMLLRHLVKETASLDCVRLSCRADYAGPNRLWPEHGFVCAGERPGRGRNAAPLFVWRRANVSDAPLLSHLYDTLRGDRRTVVVDANVFVDFSTHTEQAGESKALLADWLSPDIVVCATAELRNEIARHSDASVRASRTRALTAFDVLEADPAAVAELEAKLAEELPPASTASDRSDRRQLAYAIARDAHYFVTRDGVLLSHATKLQKRFGIAVRRPVDVIAEIHEHQSPATYSPIRLVGTDVQERPPTDEQQLLPFQGFAQGESKADFLAVCRAVLAQPLRYETRLFGAHGENPMALLSVDRAVAGSPTIVIARTLSHRLSGTVLRRAIAERLAVATEGGTIQRTRCKDLVDPTVLHILSDLGFRRVASDMVKAGVHGLLTRAQFSEMVLAEEEPDPAELSSAEIERLYWPVKLTDRALRTYVVPIKPVWARQLLGLDLTQQPLFAVDTSPALALENVYFSASKNAIPQGARILWYVSNEKQETVGQVLACSLCLGTTHGAARDIFRDHRRLGVYKWTDMLRLAKGDPDRHVAAYRFAFTVAFQHGVPWIQAQALLNEHGGRGNPFAGPTPISSRAFDSLYQLGVHGAD